VFAQLKAVHLARVTGVAVAAALALAGCRAGGSGASATGPPAATTAPAGTAPASALGLAAQHSQQIRSFTAQLGIQATGALTATLSGTLREVTRPTPLIAIRASGGSLGPVRLLLSNDTVFLNSPLLAGRYHKPWTEGSAQAVSAALGRGLGPLLGLLQTSSPVVQVPLFSQGKNVRRIRGMSGGTVEFGGHYLLTDVIGHLAAGLRPSLQALQGSGVSLTRFRAWLGRAHEVRRLVLIEVGNAARITITLAVTSVNRPVHVQLPPSTQIFVLGTSTAPSAPATAPGMTPAMMPATPAPSSGGPAARPSGGPGMTGPPARVPSGAPTHW
jgi:hypothetical protein